MSREATSATGRRPEAQAGMAMPRYPNSRLDRLLAFRASNPRLFASLTDATQREVEQYAIDRDAALVIGPERRVSNG